ncbi:TM2 domain-containing protein [Arcanobacterium ihumii]|uniref:TM2 domain-containing protein n=1 Tax=Arcanobacterium ihumii TaxID=2138162 RepID=UPI000F5268AE|nr:TM2 domain-containing protein [Arcanobacterium ihumii]
MSIPPNGNAWGDSSSNQQPFSSQNGTPFSSPNQQQNGANPYSQPYPNQPNPGGQPNYAGQQPQGSRSSYGGGQPFAPQYNQGNYGAYIEPKSRLVAGLLGIFLGGFGIHRFYLGYTLIGILQIIVSIVTFGIGSIWGFIEGIIIIANAGIRTDAKGMPLKD